MYLCVSFIELLKQNEMKWIKHFYFLLSYIKCCYRHYLPLLLLVCFSLDVICLIYHLKVICIVVVVPLAHTIILDSIIVSILSNLQRCLIISFKWIRPTKKKKNGTNGNNCPNNIVFSFLVHARQEQQHKNNLISTDSYQFMAVLCD